MNSKVNKVLIFVSGMFIVLMASYSYTQDKCLDFPAGELCGVDLLILGGMILLALFFYYKSEFEKTKVIKKGESSDIKEE